ncbi:MAG: glycosyltransferase family 4 protein, partial [Ignavibacteriaceae bacterium]|nr:glycosyltransferase family 4 protein [Ignavibacteriaceae bacterium]
MQEINNNPRKVLFIAYLFPPVGGSGVQRSSKFVKYLSHFDWNPIVLTVKEPYDFYRDDEMMTDVLGKCVIYRTFSIEPMKWVRKILKKRSLTRIQTDTSKSINQKSLKPGFLVKLKTYILFPDNEILWLPFAVWSGWKVIKKEQPSIIYSTASPYTDHLIALILARLFKLPWVADFRDLWVDRPNFPRNKWRLFIDRRLEKIVINKADTVVAATSLMADRFNELYPGNKYVTITNGYDEDDFSNISGLKPPENEFRITYTGIFNKERNPQKLFDTLKKMIDQNPELKSKFKLKIIGQLDNPGDFENINYFKKLGLEKYSELIEYQPHQFAINEMCQATVLLLFIGEQIHGETILTGKIFEYLRSGRPILAVVPPKGLAADVIKDTNSGLVVSNENVEEISNGILTLYDMFTTNKLESSFKRVGIEKYNRKNLTNELSEVFMKIVNKHDT